ncbi:WXG100-like domain-containing protein [Kitasatospora azatica]|uniref:WXG100-like domain-containing protein n=1 Tax=Kitasatospora azatica TaxID=58347 RepID=UPI0005686FA3|nr:hypothetical protein [Kitasatospora azatica]
MGESEAAKLVREVTGMWWPAADSDKLRQAADAWKAMGKALDDVTGPTNQAAQSVTGTSSGPAIDAFAKFWGQYYSSGKGWLPDTANACRQIAKALDDFADAVDKAVDKLEEEAAIVGATLVAGTALAFFTAGLSEAAAGAATAGIIAAADGLGIAVSETVATIAATTLTGAAFGAVESVAVDVAVAQPVRMSFGDGGFSGTEILDAAETGGFAGGATGGLGSGARALSQAADGSTSALLNGLGRMSTGLDSLPGRMATGAALGAGQDALFNGGDVNLLDVATGAVGGAAGPRGGRRPEVDGLGDGYLPKTSGSDYIEGAQSPEAEQAYQRIRQTTGDTARIAGNTKISQDVLDRIKDHIFNTVHQDVPVPPTGELRTGRFAPIDNIADLWTKAEAGTLDADESVRFKKWAMHEGVESILMANGMPYRAGVWEDGVNFPAPDSWGAHDVAPHEYHPTDPFVAWPNRGLDKPGFPIADNLSNLDEVAAIVLGRKTQ